MTYNFTATLGRAYTGVQKRLYNAADIIGIDIKIVRIPSFLDITYRVTLEGDVDNIEFFIKWFNKNFSKFDNNYGEQQEEQ